MSEAPDGLYERLVTEALARVLAELGSGRSVEDRSLEPVDSHHKLAGHLAAEVSRVLQGLPKGDKPHNQIALVNALLEVLAQASPKDQGGALQARVHTDARELLSITSGRVPRRPETPLSASSLLTRNRAEPALGHELAAEIESADRVDAIIAFITVGGLRAVWQSLEGLARRGKSLRVLTTTFTGTTEVAAVERLARLPGCEVRVSYDTRRTRLHAKAWLFSRDTGLHSAYVGSANLTATALGSGREWMVKACAADLPHVIAQFEGAFETLWNDTEFEAFDPGSQDSSARLRVALSRESDEDSERIAPFTIRPFPYQEEILERLVAEREVHGRHRNLVVAATGTGKTVIAAFDYARRTERLGTTPRLLVLAHRKEILQQARSTFRHVLRDGSFGELLAQGSSPRQWDHVFATIQSARGILDRFCLDYFKHVIIDECHHTPAPSYQALIPKLKPDILVGLTATPERSDGQSLLGDFDGHIAATLRLWGAMERQLLVPFEYYGVADETDLRDVRWTRNGYVAEDLERAYIGDGARVDLIVGQLAQRVVDKRDVRALAFCVSVEHAVYMASELTKRGLPARALHGTSSEEERAGTPRDLKLRKINVICTCDLYNEGVDLPYVDTLLLLRPTQSATLFMQQLGRGLRLDDGKETCLVLDFIGQHRAEYRLEAPLTSLTGVPTAKLAEAVAAGFPSVPAGCVVQLDRVASTRVIDSLKRHTASAAKLANELRALAGASGQTPTLGQFLEQTGRSLDDVYEKGKGWTTLRRRADLVLEADPDAEDLSRRLGWLRHADDTERLAVWRQVATPAVAVGDRQGPYLRMLDARLTHRGVLHDPGATVEYMRRSAPVREELGQLLDVMQGTGDVVNRIYPVEGWPLALHAHYQQREIWAGVGFTKPGQKSKAIMGGVLDIGDKREVLLVTLDKSGHNFSPTTRYLDYAVSRHEFHWETQGSLGVASKQARRYLDSPQNGWRFYLFVRATPDATYAFLGPVTYVKHAGDRPIGITWRLEHPLSAALFTECATLAA